MSNLSDQVVRRDHTNGSDQVCAPPPTHGQKPKRSISSDTLRISTYIQQVCRKAAECGALELMIEVRYHVSPYVALCAMCLHDDDE